jgi:phospholipase C
VSADPATENLAKIEHIVVLMLENRSFDHMLGYLSLEGGRSDIDGLKPGMANSAGGKEYAVAHLRATHIPDPSWDPDHSSKATDLQIGAGRMDGFAESYLQTLTSRHVANPDPGLVMGYYDAADLPVYDHLAREFCVCDKWHSSVAGATWPNRLYALAGRADGSRDDKSPPPIYGLHSFFRHLDAADVGWRWYSYAFGTLRCVDHEYFLTHHDRFAFVERTKMPLEAALADEIMLDADSASFLEDAARGTLAPVSWIDPLFKDFNLAHAVSNDDHPPSDVGAGQELVFLVYNALASGPLWDKTMLIVLYDEHGGFHDHVAPPAAPDDDLRNFGQYGIRVPALVSSSWVARGSVGNQLYDHTSIIKTILTRFAPSELERRSGIQAIEHWFKPGHPHYMGRRVAEARHLGELLTEPGARPAPSRDDLLAWLKGRHSDRAANLAQAPVSFHAETTIFTDLQHNMFAAEKHLRDLGLPLGQP